MYIIYFNLKIIYKYIFFNMAASEILVPAKFTT